MKYKLFTVSWVRRGVTDYMGSKRLKQSFDSEMDAKVFVRSLMKDPEIKDVYVRTMTVSKND